MNASEEQRWAMGVIKDQATANSPTVTWEDHRTSFLGLILQIKLHASRRFAKASTSVAPKLDTS